MVQQVFTDHAGGAAAGRHRQEEPERRARWRSCRNAQAGEASVNADEEGCPVGRYRRLAGALTALIVLGTLAWGAGGPAGGQEILKIGAPLAATGADAREGALTKQGYDLWVETVNTRGGIKVGGTAYKAQILYYDDQSKPQISAELTDKLISQDHVSFLLGPYGSPATFADAAIAERYKIPMVESNGAARRILDRKSTRLNSSHTVISYAVFCLKKKKK